MNILQRLFCPQAHLRQFDNQTRRIITERHQLEAVQNGLLSCREGRMYTALAWKLGFFDPQWQGLREQLGMEIPSRTWGGTYPQWLARGQAAAPPPHTPDLKRMEARQRETVIDGALTGSTEFFEHQDDELPARAALATYDAECVPGMPGRVGA